MKGLRLVRMVKYIDSETLAVAAYICYIVILIMYVREREREMMNYTDSETLAVAPCDMSMLIINVCVWEREIKMSEYGVLASW